MSKKPKQKKSAFKTILRILLIVLLVVAFLYVRAILQVNYAPEDPAEDSGETVEPKLDEDGSYYSKDDVALYIYTYGKLPSNFITKKEAQKLGWEGGSVEKYAPGKAIGGDTYSNYEKTLPAGHKYKECDIDTKGQKSRGAKRIIFSDDGLIYYTEDHYETFELLYGEE